jgi:hypothetical protein
MTDKQWRLISHLPRRVPLEPQPAQAQHVVVTLDDETKTILADLRCDLIVSLNNLTTEVKRLKDRSSGHFRG